MKVNLKNKYVQAAITGAILAVLSGCFGIEVKDEQTVADLVADLFSNVESIQNTSE